MNVLGSSEVYLNSYGARIGSNVLDGSVPVSPRIVEKRGGSTRHPNQHLDHAAQPPNQHAKRRRTTGDRVVINVGGTIFCAIFLLLLVPAYMLPESFQDLLEAALLRALERGGACMIKVGQWASTRPDILPVSLCRTRSASSPGRAKCRSRAILTPSGLPKRHCKASWHHQASQIADPRLLNCSIQLK